jgi:8-oxo-dGTP pyrophosphatase MutT (NUDIX family)/ribosomal protein S18 acetylase RimI-like enzyme
MMIRPAHAGDADALIDVDAHAAGSAERRASLRRWVEAAALTVAEASGRIQGFVVLEHGFFGRGFVPLLCVAASHRRQGIALALLDHSLRACRTDRLFTSTNASNGAAQALFIRAGFEPSGRILNLDDGDDELVYMKRTGAPARDGATSVVVDSRTWRLPHSVQVFLVSIDAGLPRFLLLQRRAREDLGLPAFWQGVTGALEAGETHARAAMREVREETGLVLDAVRSAHFEQRFPIRPQWRTMYGPEPAEVREQVFYAVVPPDCCPRLSVEHQAWRWATAPEAYALLDFGENRRCLDAVRACLADPGLDGLRRPD